MAAAPTTFEGNLNGTDAAGTLPRPRPTPNWRHRRTGFQVHGPGADLPERQRDDGRQRQGKHPALSPTRARSPPTASSMSKTTDLLPTTYTPFGNELPATVRLRQRLRERHLHELADDRHRQRHHHQRQPDHTRAAPARNACSGLVANEFVRVYHPCRTAPARRASATQRRRTARGSLINPRSTPRSSPSTTRSSSTTTTAAPRSAR